MSKVYRWYNSGLSKPILADALWPVLERKIQTALAHLGEAAALPA